MSPRTSSPNRSAPAEALAGKVALITGGASGIGMAAAQAFCAQGAQVVITGRRKAALAAAAAKLGQGAFAIEGDVADPAHHAHIAEEVRRRFEGLDIYMANAGINTIRHSSEVPEAEYDAQFATNTRGSSSVFRSWARCCVKEDR